MGKTKLEIRGMSCQHCVKTVTDALTALEGVQRVKVNLRKGEAIVHYDASYITDANLVEAVTGVGFEVVTNSKSLSLILIGSILIALLSIAGCSEMPYTGSMLTPEDVDKYITIGEDSACVLSGNESACITLTPETEDDSRPVIHIYPNKLIYVFYYEGVQIMRAEIVKDTTEIMEQVRGPREDDQPPSGDDGVRDDSSDDDGDGTIDGDGDTQQPDNGGTQKPDGGTQQPGDGSTPRSDGGNGGIQQPPPPPSNGGNQNGGGNNGQGNGQGNNGNGNNGNGNGQGNNGNGNNGQGNNGNGNGQGNNGNNGQGNNGQGNNGNGNNGQGNNGNGNGNGNGNNGNGNGNGNNGQENNGQGNNGQGNNGQGTSRNTPAGASDLSTHYYYHTKQPITGDGWLIQIYYPENYNGPRKLREDPEGYGFTIALNDTETLKEFVQTAGGCHDYDNDGKYDKPCNTVIEPGNPSTYSVQIYIQTMETTISFTVNWKSPYSHLTRTYTLNAALNITQTHRDHTSQMDD